VIKQFDSLYQLMEAFPDEQSCHDHLRAILWSNGEYCPHCGHDVIYKFSDKRTFKCAQCRQRFSIKVNTIFHDTKLPLRKWFVAIWMITSHKKGVASTKLAKDLRISQKSAWFMLHRLRHAARTRSFSRPLDGTIEADESFFGGKEKNKHRVKRTPNANGPDGKVIVFGALERGGELRTKPIDNISEARKEATFSVKPGATLVTDEHRVYRGLNRRYTHHTVRHGAGEYVRDETIHVNGIEGVWSLFKRQIYGIHHWVSPKHLQKYLGEMTWRYNRRDLDEGDRVNEFMTRVHGRLTYRALIK
jgi:transposase-like protein